MNLECSVIFHNRSGFWLTRSAAGHAAKAVGGQIVSPIRTIFCGAYWVDSTHMTSLGLPPTAYTRTCGMSDKLQAIMNNPFFCARMQTKQCLEET